jgi:hypothetical protein
MGNYSTCQPGYPGFFSGSPGFQLHQVDEVLGMQHQLECLAAKYKSTTKKVKPVNQPMPLSLNPPLSRPPLSRDPYNTPLTPNPPSFQPTSKVTEERLKLINFGPTGWLSDEELNLFYYVITLRQAALAFCEAERGLLKHSYGKPYIIPVIKHEPWQLRPIPIPGPIKDQFTELVRERLKTGLYEQSFSSYSSPVFCVKKQDGKLRIVHDLQKLNQVTIKDSGLPPSPEELVQSFTGRACYGLGDIMGGYDERELAPESRPLTTFETPLGRFQLTRLPQGATNSVAVYQAQMMWILQEEIPQNMGIFIDDGGIKGPTSDYNGETLEANPKIRRFIFEYAVTLERILFRIEEAGLTISAKKFACCVPALDLVGHVVCKEGRKVSYKKLNKIETWPVPRNPTEVRGFMGLCVYVRMFVKNFSTITAPLRKLTRKTSDWDWTEECQEAFETLKKIIGRDITLKKLDYGEQAGKIKLSVDSSFIAAGAVLTQEDSQKLDRPVLYESVVFSPKESEYSQSKLELCGVTKILKKLQTVLWGQHFELRVDAKCLIGMINNPSLPNAPMNRWIAFIKLFSFDLVHTPGKTFTMPDGLSRRPPDPDEQNSPSFDEDEKWIKPHPGFGTKSAFSVQLLGTSAQLGEEVLKLQVGFWKNLEYYLSTMNKAPGISKLEQKRIIQKSEFFFISNGILHKKNKPFSQIVVSAPDVQRKILRALHESLGHRGTEETYRRIKIRFWWPHLKKTIKSWVQSCEACQKRSAVLPQEERRATAKSTIFGRVSLDTVHIKAGRWKYLVVARDDLSGWIEAVGLEKIQAKKIAQWFQESWIFRYGAPSLVVVDGGSEFGKQFQESLKELGIEVKTTTPYYPEANGMVERGHQALKDTLVKLCGTDGKKWRNFLPLVLFADRISTKRTTGYPPFELVFGQSPVLPVDLEFETFLGIDWHKISTTQELLEARVAQLRGRDQVLQKAHLQLLGTRQNSVDYWNDKHKTRKPLQKGDLVLAYNKSLDSQWGKLFENRWNGPYRIQQQVTGGSYLLEELDGSVLTRRFAATHVKPFYTRQGDQEDRTYCAGLGILGILRDETVSPQMVPSTSA